MLVVEQCDVMAGSVLVVCTVSRERGGLFDRSAVWIKYTFYGVLERVMIIVRNFVLLVRFPSVVLTC